METKSTLYNEFPFFLKRYFPYRLHGDYADFLPLRKVLLQERESDSREVTAAAETADHHVRFGVGHLHLLHGLLSDHGLVQRDVVQHASQTVPRIFGVLQRHFDRLRNGQADHAGAEIRN